MLNKSIDPIIIVIENQSVSVSTIKTVARLKLDLVSSLQNFKHVSNVPHMEHFQKDQW